MRLKHILNKSVTLALSVLLMSGNISLTSLAADTSTVVNTTYIADGGCQASGNTGYSNLIDGNINTKWYCETNLASNENGESVSTIWVDFHSAGPITIDQYSLTTCNDSADSSCAGRNPGTWKIKAKADKDDPWTTISGIAEDTILEDTNSKTYTYDLTKPGTYQYFRFMIYESKGASGVQLSELQFLKKQTTSGSEKPSAEFYFNTSQIKKVYGDEPFICDSMVNTGNGKFTYSSDDRRVATVDANTGKVTIVSVGDGSARITAKLVNSGDYDYRNIKASYELVVSKATPNYTVPDSIFANPGQKLGDLTLPAGWAFVEPDTVLTNSNNYEIYFTPEDTANYNIPSAYLAVYVNTHDAQSRFLAAADLFQKYYDSIDSKKYRAVKILLMEEIQKVKNITGGGIPTDDQVVYMAIEIMEGARSKADLMMREIDEKEAAAGSYSGGSGSSQGTDNSSGSGNASSSQETGSTKETGSSDNSTSSTQQDAKQLYASAEPKAVGTEFTDSSTGAKYIITAADKADPTVSLTAFSKKVNKLKIQDTVTFEDVTYKVTGISKNAFKNNKNIKSITLGNNVTTIDAKAFSGASKVTRIILGKNVESIGNNAFEKTPKLKTLTIKSSKLTKKTVAKKAFKKMKSSVTVKVPKKMKKTYSGFFYKKGLSKAVKIK